MQIVMVEPEVWVGGSEDYDFGGWGEGGVV